MRISRVLTALFFMATGALHLVHPAPFAKIMPPAVPWPLATVYISGVAEIAGGIGLLIPGIRWIAVWGLVALLVAVFPANVYMAIAKVQITVHQLPTWTLWARLALQPILIWWVLRLK